MGAVVVFSEALTQQQIKNIHSKGTNDLSTFHSCNLTTELGSRLVVFYHPAACIEEKCQVTQTNQIVGLLHSILVDHGFSQFILN